MLKCGCQTRSLSKSLNVAVSGSIPKVSRSLFQPQFDCQLSIESSCLEEFTLYLVELLVVGRLGDGTMLNVKGIGLGWIETYCGKIEGKVITSGTYNVTICEVHC